MSEEHLVDLALLNIHRYRNIQMNEIIDMLVDNKKEIWILY